MENKIYDVIVIGAGSGGLNIAGFMNRIGMQVLLIDKSDKNIGGDCLNFGCVPSKALIHVAKLVHDAKQSGEYGLRVNGKVDLKKVVDYVRKKKEVIREHENAAYLGKIGMDVILGLAKFDSKDSISVNGNIYRGKKIIIATGSSPRKLKIPGIEKVKYLTNEVIFDLQKLPGELVVIGGGPIGIELAQAFSRLGSKVSVIQNGPTFLPKEDPKIANALLLQLEKEGIKFYFNSKPLKFSSSNGIVIQDKKGKQTKLKFDNVLISIGRVLNISGLDLEKAGIELDSESEGRKIKVDDYLRTTNKNVLLCGDVAGGYQFTHAAELHAGVIIKNFFSPFKKKLNNDNLSWVTYTQPEIATFGLNEKQLQERKVQYEKIEADFVHDDRAIVDNFTGGKSIIYISPNGKLLGGSMVAMNAGELFQELVLLNSSGLGLKEIFNKIYPYPTATRINKKLASHFFEKKLTNRVKGLLRFLFGKF